MLKLLPRLPISSLLLTSIVTVKSPSATSFIFCSISFTAFVTNPAAKTPIRIAIIKEIIPIVIIFIVI